MKKRTEKFAGENARVLIASPGDSVQDLIFAVLSEYIDDDKIFFSHAFHETFRKTCELSPDFIIMYYDEEIIQPLKAISIMKESGFKGKICIIYISESEDYHESLSEKIRVRFPGEDVCVSSLENFIQNHQCLLK